MHRVIYTVLLLLAILMPMHASADSVDKAQVPLGAGNDYKTITHFLCDTIGTDRSKAEAIYNWITTNIEYDVYGLQPGAVHKKDPNVIIHEGSAVCDGYSILFSAMCSEAGIRVINIAGYTKDWIFDKGDKLYMPGHMWSALLIDGRWLMTDATWGAGFVATDTSWWRKEVHKIAGWRIRKTNKRFMWQYDRKWLLQDPLEFRYTHLPSFPPFQFSDTIMPLSVFEEGDSAVRAFNAISHAVANNDELMKLSAMANEEIEQQYAARIYAFNHRFAMAAAMDYDIRAIKVIDTLRQHAATASYKTEVGKAYDLMSQSYEMVNTQSALVQEKYIALRAKNMKKYADAMDYFRNLCLSSKRMAGELNHCRQLSEHGVSGFVYTRGEYLRTIENVDTTLRPVKRWWEDTGTRAKYDSLYAIVTDSIAERKKRIYLPGNEAVLSRLLYNINDGNQQLDDLLSALGSATQLLTRESYYRYYLQDNMDEGAGKYYNAMKKLKDMGIDSSERRYVECLDSVMTLTRENIHIQDKRLETYQRILNDLYALAKSYKPDSNLHVAYSLWANDMVSCARRAAATLEASVKFIKRLNENKDVIDKNYQFIGTTAKAMQRMERTRKDMEQKTILADQLRDAKDIATCRDQLKKSLSMLEAAKY